jgi:hypothetical protein
MQASKQVSKAKATLLSQEKKGANTATAETKLRQAQSIFEMCNNEKSSMAARSQRVKAKQLKRAMVANANAQLELCRQGIVLCGSLVFRYRRASLHTLKDAIWIARLLA